MVSRLIVTLIALLSVTALCAAKKEEFRQKTRDEFFQMYRSAESTDPERGLVLRFLPDSTAQLSTTAFAELLAHSQLKLITHNYEGVQESELNHEALSYDLKQHADRFLAEKHKAQSIFGLEDYFVSIHQQTFFRWLLSTHSDM